MDNRNFLLTVVQSALGALASRRGTKESDTASISQGNKPAVLLYPLRLLPLPFVTHAGPMLDVLCALPGI